MESIAIYLLIILVLLILSAFFSGSETGLTALSSAKIHKLKTEGVKRALTVSKLRENKDKLIGAILLGNNLVNISASALATGLAISIFGDQGIFYATLVMTALVLIFAEVIPKTYAFYNAEKVALMVAPLISIIVKLFAPITSTIQIIVNLLVRPKESEDMVSPSDTLRGAIDLLHDKGEMKKTDRNMLDSILDLAETEVNEIMIHRKNIFALDADLASSEIINNVLDSPHSRIPIWRNKPDNIIGILHVKTLLQAVRNHEDDLDTLNVISIAAKPWFIPESTKLSNQLGNFRKERNHLALIVDEYGDLVGLITLEDVLEEIVGQIHDEHDTDAIDIKKLKKNTYIINGEVTIRDINRQLDWNIPDDQSPTIAGLILYLAEKFPEKGQNFTLKDYSFEVLQIKNNRIISAKVTKNT